MTTRTFTWRAPKHGERYVPDFTNGFGLATRDFNIECWVLEPADFDPLVMAPPTGDRIAGVPPWQGGRLLQREAST